MKTAIVIGATGLTGQYITRQLLASPNYKRVHVFCRRPLSVRHPKLTVHIVNFDQPESWQSLIQGDDLFSALGTTRELAGSKEAQYRVDVTYNAAVIKAAAHNGVKRLFLISSPGADASSWFFYPRIKGELENIAKCQPFTTCVLFKPSLIVGDRPDYRPAERIASVLLKPLARLPLLTRYQPISGEQLGTAIVNYAERLNDTGFYICELEEIFKELAPS